MKTTTSMKLPPTTAALALDGAMGVIGSTNRRVSDHNGNVKGEPIATAS